MAQATITSPLGNAAPGKYNEELVKTARAIAAPGKGILAADEVGAAAAESRLFLDMRRPFRAIAPTSRPAGPLRERGGARWRPRPRVFRVLSIISPRPRRPQSTGTIGNRLSSIGVENIVENRQALREM
jgi:hypothetical protein